MIELQSLSLIWARCCSQETGLRGQSLQQVRPARAAATRARSVCKAEASSQPVRIYNHPPSLSTTKTLSRLSSTVSRHPHAALSHTEEERKARRFDRAG